MPLFPISVPTSLCSMQRQSFLDDESAALEKEEQDHKLFLDSISKVKAREPIGLKFKNVGTSSTVRHMHGLVGTNGIRNSQDESYLRPQRRRHLHVGVPSRSHHPSGDSVDESTSVEFGSRNNSSVFEGRDFFDQSGSNQDMALDRSSAFSMDDNTNMDTDVSRSLFSDH